MVHGNGVRDSRLIVEVEVLKTCQKVSTSYGSRQITLALHQQKLTLLSLTGRTSIREQEIPGTFAKLIPNCQCQHWQNSLFEVFRYYLLFRSVVALCFQAQELGTSLAASFEGFGADKNDRVSAQQLHLALKEIGEFRWTTVGV